MKNNTFTDRDVQEYTRGVAAALRTYQAVASTLMEPPLSLSPAQLTEAAMAHCTGRILGLVLGTAMANKDISRQAAVELTKKLAISGAHATAKAVLDLVRAELPHVKFPDLYVD